MVALFVLEAFLLDEEVEEMTLEVVRPAVVVLRGPRLLRDLNVLYVAAASIPRMSVQ